MLYEYNNLYSQGTHMITNNNCMEPNDLCALSNCALATPLTFVSTTNTRPMTVHNRRAPGTISATVICCHPTLGAKNSYRHRAKRIHPRMQQASISHKVWMVWGVGGVHPPPSSPPTRGRSSQLEPCRRSASTATVSWPPRRAALKACSGLPWSRRKPLIALCTMSFALFVGHRKLLLLAARRALLHRYS